MKTTTTTAGKQFHTRIDVNADNRAELIALLNQQLANLNDLQSQCKHAHWNVKGMNFYGLHQLFDTLHELVEKNTDMVAERLTALGGYAKGTVRSAAQASELDEFPMDVFNSLDLVPVMADRFGDAANSAREGIDTADGLEDKGTSDLLTDVTRDLDQGLYFLEAHLNATK